MDGKSQFGYCMRTVLFSVKVFLSMTKHCHKAFLMASTWLDVRKKSEEWPVSPSQNTAEHEDV